MKKFLIVDGNSLIHRAFYALPLLTNAQGEYTNAVYGFINMFAKIIDAEKPDHIVVCFDKGRMTFRTEQYPQYKGHRKATPPELKPQFATVKNILTALNIAYEELEGYEADDLIGTLALKGEEAGFNNLILTGDKDALQLVSDDSEVLLIRKGISDIERFDEKAVAERYNLKPSQISDLKGLMGDPSDNIPGVPGVGEKTAQKLLWGFQSVENILAHLDEVSPAKLQEKIRENQDLALMSKQLATIECSVPVEVDLVKYAAREPDYSQLLGIYRELEFKSLVKGILEKMAKSPEQKNALAPQEDEKKYHDLNDPADQTAWLEQLEDLTRIALEVTYLGKYFDGKITSCALAVTQNEAYSIAFDPDAGIKDCRWLIELLENPAVAKVVYNAKELQVLLSHAGISLKGVVSDVMLGAYLLNPTASDYSLENLSLEYLDQALVKNDQASIDRCTRAALLGTLAGVIEDKINEQEMSELYQNIELPLEGILAGMEITGVKVDAERLRIMSHDLEITLEATSKEIYALAGEEFNINSPKQLGVILFEKLGLPPIKKTKTGFSTNAEVLEQLADSHEIINKILEHRTLAKLKSTYADGLQALINKETGKLHTSFNQTVTATGRLSSTEPNLQNIPIRMELGREIRKSFIPDQEQNILLAGDYSQIELRVLAHISQDPVLIEAFLEDQDIHTRTAAEVFGVPMEDVTREMRRRAKAVNFGIIYGISDYGLSRDLGISRKEAKSYIDSYFERYPGVEEYLQNVVLEARNKGYVTTLMKRRRYLPDLFSSNFNVRSFGERTAMNTPIQGSAADIIKVAMVHIDRFLKENSCRSKMILQVHDELIFDVVPGEIDLLTQQVPKIMENALLLRVPLKVDMKKGKDWYHMEKIS